MPARKGEKVVVANLRDQPVEIHHGADVIVVAPLERIVLPVEPAGGEQLAELARQGLVSVESRPAPASAAKRRPRAAASKPRSQRKKTNPPKPKPPERGS